MSTIMFPTVGEERERWEDGLPFIVVKNQNSRVRTNPLRNFPFFFLLSYDIEIPFSTIFKKR